MIIYLSCRLHADGVSRGLIIPPSPAVVNIGPASVASESGASAAVVGACAALAALCACALLLLLALRCRRAQAFRKRVLRDWLHRYVRRLMCYRFDTSVIAPTYHHHQALAVHCWKLCLPDRCHFTRLAYNR